MNSEAPPVMNTPQVVEEQAPVLYRLQNPYCTERVTLPQENVQLQKYVRKMLIVENKFVDKVA